jgi:hypothetical protein
MPGWAKNASMARLKSTSPVLLAGQADSTYRQPLVSTAGFGALSASISRRWNSLANASTEGVLPNPGKASIATAPLALTTPLGAG